MNKKTIAIIAGIIVVFGIVVLCLLPGSSNKEKTDDTTKNTTEKTSETAAGKNGQSGSDVTEIVTDEEGNTVISDGEKQTETSENGAFIIEDEGDSDSGTNVDFDDLFGDDSGEKSQKDDSDKSKNNKNNTDKSDNNKKNSDKTESVTKADGSVSDNNSSDSSNNSEEVTVKKEDETQKSETPTKKEKELVGEDNTEEGYVDFDFD